MGTPELAQKPSSCSAYSSSASAIACAPGARHKGGACRACCLTLTTKQQCEGEHL